jgi:hypothetical protein
MTTDRVSEKRLVELIASSESLCIIREPGFNVFDTIAALRELRDLRAERDAEKLKRQQAEHERDCILEDLAGALAVLRAIAEDDDEEFVTPIQIIRDSARAFLAAQEKP